MAELGPRADVAELQTPRYRNTFRSSVLEAKPIMGIRNYLIEGVSGTGKTSVAEELRRRGFHAIHGDRELKYWGDPKTGAPLVEPLHDNEKDKVAWRHEHLLWDADKVRSAIADQSSAITFFCGGSRNFSHFIDLMDRVFVLDVHDLGVLYRRLDERVALDPTDFGGTREEKKLIARLHETQEDVPHAGALIDAAAPIARVVDEILSKCRE
jgi:adenylate kinase family enzyme